MAEEVPVEPEQNKVMVEQLELQKKEMAAVIDKDQRD
jgi:hypothetical protein